MIYEKRDIIALLGMSRTLIIYLRFIPHPFDDNNIDV